MESYESPLNTQDLLKKVIASKHLCSMCKFSIPECGAKNIIFACEIIDEKLIEDDYGKDKIVGCDCFMPSVK